MERCYIVYISRKGASFDGRNAEEEIEVQAETETEAMKEAKEVIKRDYNDKVRIVGVRKISGMIYY